MKKMNSRNSSSGSGAGTGTDDFKKDTISQVLNLLRTNTQNIFHLEKGPYPIVDSSSDATTTTSVSSSAPVPATPTNKQLLRPKGNHKYSKSATTAADFKHAQEKALEWKKAHPDHSLDVVPVIELTRPRSYSASSPSVPILDEDTTPQPSPTPKRGKGKKEGKRGSKGVLAPVMPFTSKPKKGSSLLNVDSLGGEGEATTTTLIEDGTNETLVALNASKEQHKRKKKERSVSQSAIMSLTTSSGGSTTGYFDRFMSDFYPNLPHSRASTPPTQYGAGPGISEKESKDYHKMFSLPLSETILEKFKCAHRGKLLKQGKLLLTQKYLCFYSTMFMTKKVIRLADVTNIRKISTAFLLSDAIKIVAPHKKYYFGLFTERDKAYETLVNQWVRCGAQLSPAIKQDLNTTNDMFEQDTQPMQRMRSSPLSGRLRPSMRDLFSLDTQLDSSTNKNDNNGADNIALSINDNMINSPGIARALNFDASSENTSPSFLRADSSPSFNYLRNNHNNVPLGTPSQFSRSTSSLHYNTPATTPNFPNSAYATPTYTTTTPTLITPTQKHNTSAATPQYTPTYNSTPSTPPFGYKPTTNLPFNPAATPHINDLTPVNNIYAAYKFKSTYPQSVRGQRASHLFNENTVSSISKWLVDKAEDVRYRSGQGLVFGTDLEQLTLSEKGETPYSSVPTFVVDVLSYLQVSGVRVKRLFSQIVDLTEVAALRASVEAGRQDFFMKSTNPKLLAALLAQFLRELPAPIICNFLVVVCAEMEEPVYRKSCLRSFVYSLPFHHRTTLNAMIFFFRVLGTQYNINETTAHDLASIFGPILINKPNADLMYIAETVRVVEQLMQDYDDIFSDKDVGAVYIMKRGNQVVKAITFDYLIVKIADPYYGEYEDPDFLDIVVTTHNLYYIKTEELVTKLIALYDGKNGTQLWKQKLRLRILEMLAHIVPMLPATTGLGSREPAAVVAWFYTRHYNSSASKEELIQLDALVKPKIVTRTPPDISQTKQKKIKAKYQPLDLATQDVACQIALVDLKYYKELPLEELMAKNFSKPEKSPHFQAMVQLFNRWSAWVGTEIFACADIHARANAIEKIIGVAECLRHLQDFHGAYAITAGLGHYSIVRLHLTLEKVNKKAKHTLTTLQDLFNSEANHKTYRDVLQHAKPPLVPYLGLYSKDLFVVEENLGPNTLESGMVNFEKMRSVFAALKTVKHLQTFTYPFPEVPALAKLMLEKHLMSEDEMDEKSKEYEPRKPRPPPPPITT